MLFLLVTCYISDDANLAPVVIVVVVVDQVVMTYNILHDSHMHIYPNIGT